MTVRRSTANAARTVVVDDHDVARLGLVAILEGIPGVSVVAEANDAPSAVQAVHDFRADLVLLDVRMPDTEGIQAARQIHALRPSTKIVMVSYWDVPEYREAARAAGAAGYLSKGASRDEIVDVIDRVLRNEPSEQPEPAVVPPPDAPTQPTAAARAAADRLAPRQREVLALLALGLSNRDIGARLEIAPSTAKKTVERILSRLGVPNRTQAARIWLETGYAIPQP